MPACYTCKEQKVEQRIEPQIKLMMVVGIAQMMNFLWHCNINKKQDECAKWGGTNYEF